jgi:dimethylargininase
MTRFKQAILKSPCPSIVNGITTASLGKPVFETALIQHKNYREKLSELGLEVKLLEPDDRFPDSVFMEDTALCTNQFAVVSSPGAESRRGETEGFRKILGEFYETVYQINFPGTLEPGDVMMAGSHFFIGISDRTNSDGADQLITILRKHGLSGSKIELKGLLHLKSGVSYLENETVVVACNLENHPAFAGFRKIHIPENESYAANSLWINDTVLVPEGFPVTRERIEKAGYTTATLDMSEFRKVDGGLSCLSLRF